MSGLRPALPDWLRARLASDGSRTYPDVDARMALVLALCREQVEQRSGGPFAAAIFDRCDGRLLAAGVNRVEAEQCSLLHAEIVAILCAQQALQRWDLSADGLEAELVSSAAPCAMCLGAIPWAGLCSVVCAARDEDVRAIGFDEGCKPEPWTRALAEAGIGCHEDVQRSAAVEILHRYREQGGLIYNPGPS